MKFTLTMEVGDNSIKTASDLRHVLIGIAHKIDSEYGMKELKLIPWGPLAGMDGKQSDVLAITAPDVSPTVYRALRSAEKFIEEELQVRNSSFLPGESPYIDDAQKALNLVTAALDEHCNAKL